MKHHTKILGSYQSCKYFIALILLIPFCSAFADMDCGNGWISVSTPDNPVTEATVLTQCGKPTRKHSWTEEHSSYSGPYSYKVGRVNKTGQTKSLNVYATDYAQKDVSTIHFSRWTYNRGSNTFIEYLLFRNGVLVNITEGDYGTN